MCCGGPCRTDGGTLPNERKHGGLLGKRDDFLFGLDGSVRFAVSAPAAVEPERRRRDHKKLRSRKHKNVIKINLNRTCVERTQNISKFPRLKGQITVVTQHKIIRSEILNTDCGEYKRVSRPLDLHRFSNIGPLNITQCR